MIHSDSVRTISRTPVHPERVSCRHDAPLSRGDFVLYWMQRAQRVSFNPALETAVYLAKELHLPLVVLFVLADYPGAVDVHYRFMLDGLARTAEEIQARGGIFALRSGHPPLVVSCAASRAALLIGDAPRHYTEELWRRELSAILSGEDVDAESPGIAKPPYYELETEAVVPPRLASAKEEWSARTLRLKLSRLVPDFLRAPSDPDWSLPSSGTLCSVGISSIPAPLQEEVLWASHASHTGPAYPGDRSGEQSIDIPSGHAAAVARLDAFLSDDGLFRYESAKNDPSVDAESGMSAYLHFGQISPVEIALRVLDTSLPHEYFSPHPADSAQHSGAAAYLEQLIVRRELAVNFTLRNPACTRYETAVPDWARTALGRAENERSDRYSREELESASTEDPYWNAAQNQMVLTGKMHSYMRMYWGKRVLTWRRQASEAFSILVDMNDHYSLDGRDPNGYAGIAWCFGRHDRPWPAHPGFGTVRMMTASGLKRKFDMDSYTSRMAMLYSERKMRP